MTKTAHAEMDVGVLDRQTTSVADPTVGPVTIANERRLAWARSRDSTGQGSQVDHSDPKESQSNGNTQSPEPGQVPSKIVPWLIDCRTPLGASLDDQSASPSKGVRTGCSFEDDLSLGAEANTLLSKNNKTEACSFDLVPNQKRTRYKERGRSMNSTGSGKSSTVSSVSELLDLYEEDPEEILLNLGFGREEPDPSTKIPPRFFNSSSSARGIDIKVYLGAQLQRLELENPNYALTSRFRQIEVLTTVANEFFQLYSQVSGNQVNKLVCTDQGGEGEKGPQKASVGDEPSPLKRSNSARNMAKLIKKMSRQNLLGSASESPEGLSPNQRPQMNGHGASPDLPHAKGQPRSGTEPERSNSNSDHQVDTVSQKHIRRKDNFPLATVTEETNGGGEGDRLMESSAEQCSVGPKNQEESPDLHQKTLKEGDHVARDETDLTSTPENVPSKLAPPLLAQLRTENADSFDMEEIQTNEDEVLPSRTSRTTDLSRTISQQSDSSGFAEEPSGDSSSYLKVQESCDSCDSETTVTSHPSQDVTTPQPLDQPAFELPDGKEKETGPAAPPNAEQSGTPMGEEAHEDNMELFPQYSVHQLPINGVDRDTEQKPVLTQTMSGYEEESQEMIENTLNPTTSEQVPQLTDPSTLIAEGPTAGAEKSLESDSVPNVQLSPVLSTLNLAKRNQLRLMGQHNSIQIDNPSQTPDRRQGRRGLVPLQRSSSLPSSLLPLSRVVSSVRIQFGQGKAFVTPPRYSFKYAQEDGEQVKDEVTEEKDGGEQSNCLSTLIINPGSKEKTPAANPPKPISNYLMRSSHSLQSSSPPHDCSPSQDHFFTTQSVPDLSSSNQHPSNFHLNSNQNQQSCSPGHMMYPNHNASTLGPEPGPFPSSSTYPYPPYHYFSPPYVPRQHNPSYCHYSSLTSLHPPATPPIPQHSSLLNLHQPHPSSAPHIGFGHSAPGTPPMHPQGYNPSFSYPLPFPGAPHGHQFGSPYYGTQGYNLSPHLNPGLPPAAALGSGPGRCPSSTEMQLRKVLHEIRGTIQSLNQSRDNSPDLFCELRAAATSQQSLAEFQQKRRSLSIFRSQMTDLELSIMQQQAIVYNHLSPADRMEAEKLQCLRSAVREELQELEQQLEDRLIDLSPHSRLRVLHREGSVDSLSAASALRAMEPVSDLLREQFFLQSELGYDGRGPSSFPSTRSPSPVRDGHDGKQRQGVYRASINITPAPPVRPDTHSAEVAEEESQRVSEEVAGEKGGEEHQALERDGEARKYGAENFQQLIRQVRESLAHEVRREIYNELLAAVSPQGSERRLQP